MSNQNLLRAGNSLHVGMVYEEHTPFEQHVHVWRTVSKFPKTNYDVITTFICGERRKVLMFRTADDMAQFTTWIDAYTARFSGETYKEDFYPTTPDGGFVSGYTVPINKYSGQTTRTSMLSDWLWIVANTKDPVVMMTDRYWIFENKAEMLMFKLTLSGKKRPSVPSMDDDDEYEEDDQEDVPF